MQLYYSTASPYARVVRVIARELGLALDEKLVNPFDNSDELLSVNPLGKVPCLLLDDGAALFDSEVIARFLDDKFGQNCFFGPPGNWAYECQFSLLKGALDSAVGLRQEQMREEEGGSFIFLERPFRAGPAQSLNGGGASGNYCERPTRCQTGTAVGATRIP